MLGFNMETKRINELVNIGARTKMTDLEFLAEEVKKFLKSPQRLQAIDGDMYYD